MKSCKKIALLLAALALLTAVLAIGIAAEDKPALDIYAANLSFEDSVYLMYAVDAENVSADQVKMLFWTAPILEGDPDAYVKGTEDYVGTNCGDVTIKDSTYKMFKYDKLHAKNMTDVIYARAYVEVDGVAYYSQLSKYSILQYAYNKLGYTGTASTSSKLKAMLTKMLEYGATAQQYFEYNTDRLATDSFYQIKLEGGVLSDGCAHGLYLEGEQVGISADIENFVRWTDTDGYTVFTDAAATITLDKANTTYIATDVGEPTGQNGLEFTLNADGESYTVTGIGTCIDTDIIIPQTYEDKPVTAIGNKAFSEQTGITSITLPNTIKTIGTRAFYGCSGLTEFTVPASVTSIGTQIFYKCSNLTTVYYNSIYSPGQSNVILNQTSIKKVVFGGTEVPGYIVYQCANIEEIVITSSVKSLSSYAFRGYIGSAEITIPDSVTSIGYEAFYYCSSLTSVTIPDSVTYIGYEAFSGCSSLTTITIPDSVTTIGGSAFSGCSSLTSVTIPDSVTTIGDYAFYGCTGLTSITIPDSVTTIGASAFSYCTGLTSVTIPDSVTSIGDSAFSDCTGLTSVTIPDSVTSIGDWAFRDCTSLTSVTIGNSVTSIGSSAFYGCSSLTDVYITDVTAWLKIYFGNTDAHPNYYGELHILDAKGNEVTELVIPDSVTSIGGYAFYGCRNLTSVTIPDSVISIGDYAFYGCGNLISVTIPDSVTSIGNWAFSDCTGLTSVTIPDSVTSISNYAFNGCYRLVEVINKSTLNVQAGSSNNGYVAYYAKEVHTGESKLISVGDYLFYTYNGIHYLVAYTGSDTSVTLPASYNGDTYEINQHAFRDCSSLTSVTIPDSVTTIGGSAFSGCSSLTSVTIPDSVTFIGSSAFYECSGLTSVTIPDSVTSIGSYAFEGCTGLTSVTIPDSVTTIGRSAFEGCTGLTSVTIPDSVTSISGSAFRYCSNLTSVTIPDSVTSIGYEAFYYCTGLTTVYYGGTADQWTEISISSYNTSLTSATRYYYSETAPTEAGNYWHWVDGVPTKW